MFDLQSEKEYRENIKRAIENNSTYFFNCNGDEHNSYIIKSIFEFSKGTAYILSNNFNTEIYNLPQIINAANKFLEKKDNNLEIIIQSNNNNNVFYENFFLQEIIKKYPNKINLYGSLKGLISYQKNIMIAPTIMDGIVIKLEENIKNKINVVNFNIEKQIGQNILKQMKKWTENISTISIKYTLSQ